MPTNMEALLQLVDFSAAGVAEERLVSGVAAAVEPFFAAAESYALRPASEVGANRVIGAVSNAVGKLVKEAVFVDALEHSLRRGRHRLGKWTVDLSGDTAVREQDVAASLADQLRQELGPAFDFCVDGGKMAAVNAALWSHLWCDLRPQLQKISGKILSAAVRDNLWVSLFYLLGFAHAGNTKRVRQLLPLIELLPQAIPIGESHEEPGTWFVLAAKEP